MPNSALIQFSASPTTKPTATNPVVSCPVQAGYPVVIDWCYNSANGSTYFVAIWPDRSRWTFQTSDGTSSITGLEYPVKIADSVGNYINLNWSNFTYKTMDPVTGGYQAQGLVSITDSSNNALLTVAYNSGSQVTSVSDRYGRSVYYTIQNFANTGVPPYISNQTTDELTQASQIVPTGTSSPAVRYQYGYQNYGNTEQAANETVPYLHTISVPSATGSGMATATINYNTIGEVSNTVDANGNKTVYSPATKNGAPQSNSGRVQIYNPSGTLVLQYDKYFNSGMSQTQEVNSAGQTVWTQAYGDPNTPFGTSNYTDGNGLSHLLTHDQFGNLTSSKSPKGVTTSYSLSYVNFPLGELNTVTVGSQTATGYAYFEPSGLIKTISSPIPGQSGTGSTQATSFTYDALGNLIQVTTPGNNAAGNHTTTYGYTTDGTYTQSEALRQPITVTDTLGYVTHMRYDVQNNMLSDADALGNTTTYTYNISNQMLTEVHPATGQTGSGNGTFTYGYLYIGGPLTQLVATNEAGSTVRVGTSNYGLEGELLAKGGAMESVSYTYDAAYHLASVTDGNAHVTSYTYDLYGRMSLAKYPNQSGGYDEIQFTSYDPANHLTGRTNGNGQAITLSYSDGDGLFSGATYTGNSQYNVSVTHDSYDRVSEISDSTGSETTTHDDLGYPLSTTRTYSGVPAQTTSYTYWPDSTRESMTNLAGTWSYNYDGDARYTSMTSPVGTAAATYYNNGWQASRTLPNGSVTNYSYNAIGKPTSLLNETSTGTTLSQYSSFGYDGLSNLASLTASVPGATNQTGTTTYSINSLNRMTGETSSRNGGYSATFGYDGAGNPTTFKGTTATFNSDNQISGPGSFVFDGDGNATTYAGTACSYDPENRLINYGATWSAEYRADGLRASKTVNGVTTYFLYDGGQPIVEMNSGGTITAVNVFAPDGLVARQQAGSWTQYTFDPQGNVAQRLNSSQAVVSSSMFDAFGVESAVGSPTDTFGFNAKSGYYFDRENGMYLCEHRYYDPSRGQWLNRDPLLALMGTGLYRYCSSQPLLTADAPGYWGGVIFQCASAVWNCTIGGGVGGILQLLNNAAGGGGGANEAVCAAASGCLSNICSCAVSAFCDTNPICGSMDGCVAGIGSAIGGALGQVLCDQAMHAHDPCYTPTTPACLLAQAIGSIAAGCLSGFVGSEVTTAVEDEIMSLIGQSAGSAAGFGCSAMSS